MIVCHPGVGRGIAVSSRRVLGNFVGGIQSIFGMRFEANDMMDGITEVLAYGTAVWVEPAAARGDDA